LGHLALHRVGTDDPVEPPKFIRSDMETLALV
jgi:hypothetical protein